MVGIRTDISEVYSCAYCGWPPEGWRNRYDGSRVEPREDQILSHVLQVHPEKVFARIEKLEAAQRDMPARETESRFRD